jgi:hypothetical protein
LAEAFFIWERADFNRQRGQMKNARRDSASTCFVLTLPLKGSPERSGGNPILFSNLLLPLAGSKGEEIKKQGTKCRRCFVLMPPTQGSPERSGGNP